MIRCRSCLEAVFYTYSQFDVLSAILPGPDSAGIDVYETVLRVISHPAVLEAQGGCPQILQSHLGNKKVDGPAAHVEAVMCDMSALVPQKAVECRASVSGNYMYLVVPAELIVHHVQVVQDVGIHVDDFVVAFAAQ